MKIKTSRRLAQALGQYAAMQARRNALETRIELLRKALVAWYEHNNRTQFIDTEGNVWRKMQGSTTLYDDAKFKKFLRKKGIKVDAVYQVRKIEERDEQAIAKLLREKKLTIKEWKKYAKIHYHQPYIRKYPPEKSEDRDGSSRRGSINTNQS